MTDLVKLIARTRGSYRTLHGVVVVSPVLLKQLADELEKRLTEEEK